MTFQRENRYIVIKLKDLHHDEEEALRNLISGCNIRTRECLVIESDWPEYEPAWRMIQARVEGATLSPAHIEDGEEVEVVGYRVSMPGEPELGTWLDEAAEEEPQIQHHEPLMTVAQHQRIVDARASKAAAHVEDERERSRAVQAAFNDWAWNKKGEAVGRMDGQSAAIAGFHAGAEWQARAALSAPPAADIADAYVGAREDVAIWKRRALEAEEKLRTYDQRIVDLGVLSLKTAVERKAPPAAGVPDGWKLVPIIATVEQRREVCMHPDLAAPLYSNMVAAAPTPPASEQQRAVVMPERKAPFEGADGPPDWRPLKNAEVRGWNACLAEFLRLNPHLAKGEGV